MGISESGFFLMLFNPEVKRLNISMNACMGGSMVWAALFIPSPTLPKFPVISDPANIPAAWDPRFPRSKDDIPASADAIIASLIPDAADAPVFTMLCPTPAILGSALSMPVDAPHALQNFTPSFISAPHFLQNLAMILPRLLI